MKINERSLIQTILIILLLNHSISWDYLPKTLTEFSPGKSGGVDIFPNVARLSNDNYVITWTATINSTQQDIYFSIYDPSGKSINATTKANDTSLVNSRNWTAADKAGGFVLVWNRSNAIYARYFDATYTATGPSIMVNTLNVGGDPLYPSIIYTGTNYFVGYNPHINGSTTYRQMISVNLGTLALVGSSNTRVGSTTNKAEFEIFAVGLGNGNIAAVYHSNEYGSFDVLMVILKESDLSVVKAETSINTNKNGVQANPMLDLLSNQTFVVAWEDMAALNSSGDIVAQIFNLDGTTVGSNFKVNKISGGCVFPVPRSIGNDGFAIAYRSSISGTNVLYYTLFDLKGNKVGTEWTFPIPIDGTNIDIPYTIDSKPGVNFLLAYSNGSLTYAQFFYRDSNDCQDSSIIVGMDATSKKIQFSVGTNPHLWIWIAVLPTNGTLKTSTGVTLTTNKLYDITDVNYTYTNIFADTIKWATNSVDTPCTITINACYTSCFSCTTVGTSTSHQCTACDSNNTRGGGNYYPLETDATMCYKSSDSPAGFYLATNIWKKCNNLCKTCTGTPTTPTTDMLCSTCIANYYPKIDNMTSCFTGTFPLYFFSIDKYLACYSSCQTCSAAGDINNHQCDTCKTGFYPKADNKTSCYNTTPPQYYFDGALYQPCYSSCQTCTVSGTSTDQKCQTCLPNYYPTADNAANCYNTAPNSYYFDGTVYQKCYSTCLTCMAVGTVTNHNCKTCIAGDYQKVDNMTSCFVSPVNGYYLDTNNIFQKCYSTCATCTNTAGTATNHQCKLCLANYFPKSDNLTSCFTGTIDGYYFDKTANLYQKCYSTCKVCNSVGTLSDHLCTVCLDTYFPKVDALTSCFTGNQDSYYFDVNIYRTCYLSCKTCKSKGNDTDHQCNLCLTNYYPRVDMMTSCFKSPLDSFYLDSNSIFQLCHKLCKTCTKAGTDTDNQCITCIATYYHKVDDSSNCFTGKFDYYYFDTNIYKQCFPSCQTCSGAGSTTDHACAKCKANYFPKVDNLTSCFTGNIDQYYLDINIYRPCYSFCKTCTIVGTDTNNQCTTCKQGYKLTAGTTNCQATGEPLPGYYFDPVKVAYNPCFPNCTLCLGPGTKDIQNCTQCIVGLYLKEKDPNGNCYIADTIIPNYYLNKDQGMFFQCYVSCAQCSYSGTDVQHNCIECAKGYAPLYIDNTMCFKTTAEVDGYNYDLMLNVFKPCFKSCKTCSSSGDETNNSCTSCLDNYYVLEDDSKQCLKADQYVIGYYFDSVAEIFKNCYSTCYTCSGPGDIRNPNCEEFIDTETTEETADCKDLIYKDTCVKECPDKTILDTSTMTCYDCRENEFFFNNQCVQNCPNGLVKKDDSCVTCQSLDKFYYHNSCVDTCPEDTIIDQGDNYCIDFLKSNYNGADSNNNTQSNNSTVNQCLIDTCQNGGSCSMRFNLIYCLCQNGFTGVYCQLLIKDELNTYISNISLILDKQIVNLQVPMKRDDIFTLLDFLAIVKTNDIGASNTNQLLKILCKI
jgi:hypothetical protein